MLTAIQSIVIDFPLKGFLLNRVISYSDQNELKQLEAWISPIDGIIWTSIDHIVKTN